jgi:hypothetical protein
VQVTDSDADPVTAAAVTVDGNPLANVNVGELMVQDDWIVIVTVRLPVAGLPGLPAWTGPGNMPHSHTSAAVRTTMVRRTERRLDRLGWIWPVSRLGIATWNLNR